MQGAMQLTRNRKVPPCLPAPGRRMLPLCSMGKGTQLSPLTTQGAVLLAHLLTSTTIHTSTPAKTWGSRPSFTQQLEELHFAAVSQIGSRTANTQRQSFPVRKSFLSYTHKQLFCLLNKTNVFSADQFPYCPLYSRAPKPALVRKMSAFQVRYQQTSTILQASHLLIDICWPAQS